MLLTKNYQQLKPLIFILLLIPSFIWVFQFFNGNLGVNPIENLMDKMGLMALRIIILTLLVSSLADIKSFKSIIVLRRMIGLFAFYYVCLHFLTYVVLDHFFDITFIFKDIAKRPFITFGFISFICLIPLAITSNKLSLRKLGYKLWKRIHYLIYIAAILSSFHFYMLVRANKTEPLIYIIIIILLLSYRMFTKVIFPRLFR
tara:strand:- start:1002 stop:1607 length:606 start_codon:yes stop_codon:yes gene_type:complete